MARSILGKKDKDKKDKKKRRKSSSSDSGSEADAGEPLSPEEMDQQLLNQLSLKAKDLRLKAAVKYEDLSCAA